MKAKQKSNNILFTMIKNLFSCKSRAVSIQIFLLYTNFNFITQNTIESKPKNIIKKNTTISNKEITPKLVRIQIKDIKITRFSTRFILPKDWFQNFMNSDDKNNNKNIINIKNSVFLNTKKNDLKKNLDFEKIVIVVYEIMENILYLEYDIDYLIIINYDSKNNSFDFEDIIEPGDFYTIEPNYEQIEIDKGYFEPINSKEKINPYESTNELLNSQENKNSETKIKVTKTEKNKNINNNEENEENIKLKGKRNNYSNKKETKNELKNTEEEKEDNIEELSSGEKMHNNSHNFKTSNNKEINNDIILINKNNTTKNNNYIKENDDKQINEIKIKEKEKEEINENDKNKEKAEENKIYFFNEKQMIINLSNFKGESIKPVGLINPSIYCFMISILQSLISIPELNYFFLSKIYLFSSLYNNTNNNDNNQDIYEDELKNNYPICTSYQYFIKIYLLSKKKNYIQIPRNIFIICNKLLGGMRMHDSQEFFVCFLEALQQELNLLDKNKKIKKEEKKEEKKENPTNMDEKWIEYRIKNNSFIDSIFTGLMRSTVECKNCKHRSITYDPFIDLNLSINKYKNLEKCLKQYFELEKIDCEYKCDNCKQISKVSI